jgi:hypothetical protein
MKFPVAAIACDARIEGLARRLAIHPEHGAVCLIFMTTNSLSQLFEHLNNQQD